MTLKMKNNQNKEQTGHSYDQKSSIQSSHSQGGGFSLSTLPVGKPVAETVLNVKPAWSNHVLHRDLPSALCEDAALAIQSSLFHVSLFESSVL